MSKENISKKFSIKAFYSCESTSKYRKFQTKFYFCEFNPLSTPSNIPQINDDNLSLENLYKDPLAVQ